MSSFIRCLQPRALAALHGLTEQPGQNWWKDLLTLWEPSGSAAGGDGLRLAIRNNYLNFYSRGQSVARVGFTPTCEAYVDTHVKYAFGPGETIQDYARLSGTTIFHPKTGEQLSYKGHTTLHEWIEQTANHAGEEKRCVDELVGSNPSIIDLEMGLPAAGERKTAQRMDCVALELGPDAIHIVFWEAKMIDDDRLRSRSKPEVVNQVQIYRDYLTDPDQALNVEASYRNVCRLLRELRAMGASLGKELKLDPLILEAAEEGTPLKVDLEPRLVIFGGKYLKKGAWPDHEGKLWKLFQIPYLIFGDETYTLRRPEMKV